MKRGGLWIDRAFINAYQREVQSVLRSQMGSWFTLKFKEKKIMKYVDPHSLPYEPEEVPLTTMLQDQFPHGHPEFIPTLLDKMKLHSDKNHDYASGGDPLGNFKRVANILGQYPGLPMGDSVVVMLTYAMKQIDAVLWGLTKGIDHKVEGPIDRLADVLVYAGIAICDLKDRKKAKELEAVVAKYNTLQREAFHQAIYPPLVLAGDTGFRLEPGATVSVIHDEQGGMWATTPDEQEFWGTFEVELTLKFANAGRQVA